MNKKAAFYKYAKLYTRKFIKYADYTPLPNSGVLGMRDNIKQYFPQYTGEQMFTGTQNDVFNNAYDTYKRNVAGSQFDVASQYESARRAGNEWGKTIQNINNANRIRTLFMPTYSPQMQPIVQQLPLYGNLDLNSFYDPYNNRMLAGNLAVAAPHELEHLIDITRGRTSTNTAGYKKLINANELQRLNYNMDSPEYFYEKIQGSEPALARVRMERIANTVPQMRLRKMWGPNLTPNQQAIINTMDLNSQMSMGSYENYLPGHTISPDTDRLALERAKQLEKGNAEFMRRINKELRLAKMTPKLQDARPLNMDEIGNRFTVADNIRENVNKLVRSGQIRPEQAQQIIDSQLSELAARKAIYRRQKKLGRTGLSLSNPDNMLQGRMTTVTAPPSSRLWNSVKAVMKKPILKRL